VPAATSGKGASRRHLAYAALVGNLHVVARLAVKAIKCACLMDHAALLLLRLMALAVLRSVFVVRPAVVYSWIAWLLDCAAIQVALLMTEYVVQLVNITMVDNVVTLGQLSVVLLDAVRELVKMESVCRIRMAVLLLGVREPHAIRLQIAPTRKEMKWSVRKVVVFTRK
jgi:hypothetical protein